ncbi:unnamed protein product [Acanthoscelides obtectus]|uniref:Tc1-like transposase DDE domain-containing protein n=1 Tax=Acanthoscelides obtectus TaxID=200917 RepID=A0A9P0MBX2_ACAOB|nr:unnamed protein product [Acanthoscelides obtectus]CAK1670554.1 Histone-lysine N-methyltransferase SETMAR [Acanthoscelides obtectus]
MLLSVFGNEAPHQSTISRCLSDNPRWENVDAVRIIIEDRHVTYREIEASLKISKTSIQKFLQKELGVRKLVSQQKAARVNWYQKTIVSGDESWTYCYEPENKRQSAVWPTKVIRSRSVSKKMVATFVSKAGHIATIPLNEQRTVTADWYTTICSPKVITELRKINPERRIILHQDNASSHTAQTTRQYSTEENVELLDHPPYSPDLSPNDFFTLPKIKNRLRGQRFQSPEEAVDAFKNAVLDLPANEWNKCFENWFERMQITAEIFNERHENSNVHRKYVVEFVTKFRETGTRKLETVCGVSQRTVQRILKAHSFHPYKIHLVQVLNADDFDRRLQFCEDKNAIDPALTAIIENQNDPRYIANRLRMTFPDRWIGRKGAIEWPPRHTIL